MGDFLIKRVRPGASIPTRATEGSAGYDLCACIDTPVKIAAGKTASIPTGNAIALPDSGCAAFVFARSGLGIKHGIAPANCVGVIDSDYRGELLVGLHNSSDTDYTINPGDRIAQLVILPVLTPEFTETDELPGSDRGAGGFGSTGK